MLCPQLRKSRKHNKLCRLPLSFFFFLHVFVWVVCKYGTMGPPPVLKNFMRDMRSKGAKALLRRYSDTTSKYNRSDYVAAFMDACTSQYMTSQIQPRSSIQPPEYAQGYKSGVRGSTPWGCWESSPRAVELEMSKWSSHVAFVHNLLTVEPYVVSSSPPVSLRQIPAGRLLLDFLQEPHVGDASEKLGFTTYRLLRSTLGKLKYNTPHYNETLRYGVVCFARRHGWGPASFVMHKLVRFADCVPMIASKLLAHVIFETTEHHPDTVTWGSICHTLKELVGDESHSRGASVPWGPHLLKAALFAQSSLRVPWEVGTLPAILPSSLLNRSGVEETADAQTWGLLVTAAHQGGAPHSEIQRLVDHATSAPWGTANLTNLFLWNAYIAATDPEDAQRVLTVNMPHYQVEPNADSYSAMMESYLRAKQPQAAMEQFVVSERKSLQPTDALYAALFDCLHELRDSNAARRYRKEALVKLKTCDDEWGGMRTRTIKAMERACCDSPPIGQRSTADCSPSTDPCCALYSS